MKIHAAGKSDIGLKRKINEDSILVSPELGLYVVADGVGGHRAGEVASQMAVNTLESYWKEIKAGKAPSFLHPVDESLPDRARHLLNSIHLANLAVFEAQKENQYRGMGTTIAVLLEDKDKLWAANVGDSRIYHYNNERLMQMSKDHSLAEEKKLLEMFPGIDPNDTFAKNALTRALGLRDTVEAYLNPIIPNVGDQLLICSDGLTNYVNEEAIQLILSDPGMELERKVNVLVDEANKGGGGDNISVVLLEIQKQGKWDKFKQKFQSA